MYNPVLQEAERQTEAGPMDTLATAPVTEPVPSAIEQLLALPLAFEVTPAPEA